MNTQFISIRNLTFMGDIGMMIGDHQVLLTPGANPIVDGDELRESKVYTFEGFNVTLKKSAGHVFVDVGRDFWIKVMDIEWTKYNTNFHNVKVMSRRKGSGIIGHTWKQDVEENLDKFQVPSLFTAQFGENRSKKIFLFYFMQKN